MLNDPVCQGTRRDGSPCGQRPLAGTAWCWVHAPELAAQRAAVRRKGGQHRATAYRLRRLTPPALMPLFDGLVAAFGEVHRGQLPPGQAVAMAALARAAMAVLEAGQQEARLRTLEGRKEGL